MNKFSKNLSISVLVISVVIVVLGLTGPMVARAATTPSLGMATTYGVLAGTYSNSWAATTINGDVGFTTAPATDPAGVHTNYGSGAPYATAKTNAATALTTLSGEGCTFTFASSTVDLSTDVSHPTGVYTPGVYCSTGAMSIGTSGITLSGSGTYIFRADGALTTVDDSDVTLSGASACDVFWTPTAATTLGANTTFAGTIIDNANAITVGANTTWSGRAISLDAGVVTTGDTDTISVPVCTASLHVIKDVINNSGRTATPSLFNLHVMLSGVDVAGSPATGTTTPGTSYTLAPGTYVVSEDATTTYSQIFSGDCNLGGSVTLAAGDDKTCTITNDDIAPLASINIVKTVINDNGGTKTVADFPLFVNTTSVISGVTNVFPAPATYTVSETPDSRYTQTLSADCGVDGVINLVPGDAKFCIITNNDIALGGSSTYVPPVPPIIDVIKVPSPLALPAGPGAVLYTYTLRNIGTVPVTDITMVGDTCSPIALASGDTNADAKLDVNETWVYTCSTTLSETHTNTIVATGWANGISATDIASATVVVGLPVVPPLIHITKVPNPLTLPAGGGMVTYTKRVTNPGTVPLSNVHVTDYQCNPVNYVSGDTNGDSMLDTTETWVYTCQKNLTETTMNTAEATGEANGLTARDFALATVVVADTVIVPALPETGLSSEGKNIPWGTVVFFGVLMLLSTSLVIMKRRMI